MKIRIKIKKHSITFFPLKGLIRIYKDIGKVNGEKDYLVSDYWLNPLKQYRQKIEKELTEKYLKILSSK